MNIQHVSFSGKILERGFWLYVWRIRSGSRKFFYVGRTGDSSSRFAASPFLRLGHHLDVRQNAKANMLLRHVRKMNLDPLACEYDLIALGPIFSEQTNLELHRQYRDRISPLEAGLANHLRSRNMEVIGSHSNETGADTKLLTKIKSAFDKAMKKYFR